MACMITNAFEITLVGRHLNILARNKGKKKKEVDPNYKVLPWNIDL